MQENERAAAGEEWHEQGFVFTDGKGNMCSIYYPTELCSDFEKRHGLRHLKLHGLRHTCGSLMLAKGIDPMTVSQVLGHSDMKTTEIYLHPYDSAKKHAADVLGELMTKEINY
ncbi:MAG: tyrosine-type recombinase/integrase [Oscillospiraceae bacterium]|nr:tyrosine-type recombinase/integrase [Oscillospiraceae bacterium]